MSMDRALHPKWTRQTIAAGSYVVINSAGIAGFNGADATIKLTAGAANVKATSFIV